MTERPITRKMKAAAEAERLARLEAEYKASLAKQQAEQQARSTRAKLEWEELIRTLPDELSRIEEIVTNELIPEWEYRLSAPIDWEELQEPICSTKWILHFNEYERDDYTVSSYYESSDTRRSGTSYERIVKERFPGSYWTSPLDPTKKEWFVSRATSPDGPVPPIKYPHCTITSDNEYSLWSAYPHDRALAKAILEKHEEDRAYYQNLVNEARVALAGTTQERAKYLLSQREADGIRNALQKAWRIINPNKSLGLFWEDVLQALQ